MHGRSPAGGAPAARQNLMPGRCTLRRFGPVAAAVPCRRRAGFCPAASVDRFDPARNLALKSPQARAPAKVAANFAAAHARSGYSGEKPQSCAGLKLSVRREAPVHLILETR